MERLKLRKLAWVLIVSILFRLLPVVPLYAYTTEKFGMEQGKSDHEETASGSNGQRAGKEEIASGSDGVPVILKKKIYQAYREEKELSNGFKHTALWVKDIGGKKTAAYCYDLSLRYPSEKKDDPTLYTRIENYLESEDSYIVQYGSEKKARIATALYAGYPNDGYDLRKNYPGLSDYDARYATQNIIWAITEDMDDPTETGDPHLTDSMKAYSRAVYEYVKRADANDKFDLGYLELDKGIEFEEKDGCWKTDIVTITGNNGKIEFFKLPAGAEVYDGKTNEKISGNIRVGQSFYLKSDTEPEENAEIKIKFKFKVVKFYFYTPAFEEDRDEIQNLIQVVSTDKEEALYFTIAKEKIEELGNKIPDIPKVISENTPSDAIVYEDGFHYIKGSGYMLYCMNNKLRWPHVTSDLEGAKIPEYADGYLTEDDFQSEAEYKEFLRRAANLLYAGYPHNGAGLYEIIQDENRYTPTAEEFRKMLIPPAQLADDHPKLKHYEFHYPAEKEELDVLREFVQKVSRMSAGETTENGISKDAIEGMPFYKAALCMVWEAEGTPMDVFSQLYGTSYFVTKKQAYDATQLAFWKLMKMYGVADNDIDSLNSSELATELIAFSEQGSVLTHEPEKSDLKLEGNLIFTYHPKDGLWHSEPLKLAEPEGYHGIYNLTLPKGVRTIHNMSYVYGNEEYELVSDHRVGEDEKFGIEEKFMWLKEFRQYSPVPDIEVKGKKFQHMAAAVLEETALTAELGQKTSETGSLAVSKKLTGEDHGQEFEFHLTLPNHTISGRYGDMDFDAGYAKFYLKHGETKTAEHLPVGAEYHLMEITNGEFHVESKNWKGVIRKDQQIAAEFTNTPLPNLTINKVVSGEDVDLNQLFTFTIELKDSEGNPVDGLYEYVGDVKSGYEKAVQRPEDGEIYFVDGKAQIRLSHGQQITLQYLPYQSTYTVTELEADQDGYTTYYNKGKGAISGRLAESAVIQVENHREPASEEPVTPSEPITENPSKPHRGDSPKVESEKPSEPAGGELPKIESEKPVDPSGSQPPKLELEKPSAPKKDTPPEPSESKPVGSNSEISPRRGRRRISNRSTRESVSQMVAETTPYVESANISDHLEETESVSVSERHSETRKKPFSYSPKTGEENSIFVWILLMAVSVIGFGVCLWKKLNAAD